MTDLTPMCGLRSVDSAKIDHDVEYPFPITFTDWHFGDRPKKIPPVISKTAAA